MFFRKWILSLKHADCGKQINGIDANKAKFQQRIDHHHHIVDTMHSGLKFEKSEIVGKPLFLPQFFFKRSHSNAWHEH